jgi:hypothetical protein
MGVFGRHGPLVPAPFYVAPRSGPLTEHATKHAHPERPSGAEGSLFIPAPSKSVHPTQLPFDKSRILMSSLETTLAKVHQKKGLQLP